MSKDVSEVMGRKFEKKIMGNDEEKWGSSEGTEGRL